MNVNISDLTAEIQIISCYTYDDVVLVDLNDSYVFRIEENNSSFETAIELHSFDEKIITTYGTEGISDYYKMHLAPGYYRIDSTREEILDYEIGIEVYDTSLNEIDAKIYEDIIATDFTEMNNIFYIEDDADYYIKIQEKPFGYELKLAQLGNTFSSETISLSQGRKEFYLPPDSDILHLHITNDCKKITLVSETYTYLYLFEMNAEGILNEISMIDLMLSQTQTISQDCKDIYILRNQRYSSDDEVLVTVVLEP